MPSDSPDEDRAVRRQVHFSGRVQGVGFRYTTQAVASRFSVMGYVRNLSDGRVEIVAEGRPSELDSFQRSVEDAMRLSIDDVVVSQAAATGEFSSFNIAF